MNILKKLFNPRLWWDSKEERARREKLSAQQAWEKINQVSERLNQLGAKVFIEADPEIIDQDGRTQPKSSTLCVGGFRSQNEAEVVTLLQPLFPELRVIVRLDEDNRISTRVEVFEGG